MGWVIVATRKQALRARITELNNKLLSISQEITDLQSYASSMADGKITYDEMADLPSDYFGTGMSYNQAAANAASQSAQNKTNTYMQTNGISDTNISNAFYNSTLESELKEYAQYETKKIETEEAKLEQEKTKIETQVQAAQSEYDSISQSLDQEIKSSAIKLSANG